MKFDFWNNLTSQKTHEAERTVSANTVVEEQDGALVLEGGFSHYGHAFSGFGVEPAKDEAEQIKRYRSLQLIPEVDYAIDDIVNEAISTDTEEKSIEIRLDDVDVSENIKEKIRNEFDVILKLMKFNTRGYEYFRSFYVDGRIGFHKIVDSKKPRQGLIGIRQFDAVALRKIREVERDSDGVVTNFKEYFVYDETYLTPSANRRLRYYGKKLTLPKESVTYVTSGEFDPVTGFVISPLHKAIKWANNLMMLEDATVVYRYSRAPEKRIFYIDTGNLPPTKAEAFVARIMNRYRNKIIYDPTNGGVKDQKNLLTMYEDFWLPRSATGKGTEVTTLEGGQNLGELDDVLYFRKKLYQALGIPMSRVEQDGVVHFGKLAEITRDELKFTKSVERRRKKFAEVFTDLLGTQLVLKNIFTEQEWLNISDNVRYDFVQDAYIAQQKKFELLQSKVEVLRDMENIIGKYVSHEWVQKNVLHMSDDDIKEQRKKILEEKKDEVFGRSEDEDDRNQNFN